MNRGATRPTPSLFPKRVLTIAGSDSSGGAGIQADLKTFAAHGVYGLSAITAVTAQSTVEVRAIAEVAPAVVAAQIDAVLDDIGADAVKIGMLWSAATVRTVAARLRAHFGSGARPGELMADPAPAHRFGGALERSPRTRRPLRPVPIVLDPVMAAESGAALLAVDGGGAGEALAALLEELLPLATLVTPNLPELMRLAQAIQSVESSQPAQGRPASRLEMARLLAARGPAVLAKGGHDEASPGELIGLLLIPGAALAEDAESPDRIADEGGADRQRIVRFLGPRLTVRATHGTGCTLSAAIAARLAAGVDLAAAVGGAIEYVRRAMAAAPPLGGGAGPLAHFHELTFARQHGKSGVVS